MAYLIDRKYIINIDDRVLVGLAFPNSEIVEIK
jgi:hypothetical protein